MNKEEQLKRLICALYRQGEPEDYTDECMEDMLDNTALGSSIRPASTDVRITAGTAAQQTTTMLRTVTAMEAGAARAAASIAAP